MKKYIWYQKINGYINVIFRYYKIFIETDLQSYRRNNMKEAGRMTISIYLTIYRPIYPKLYAANTKQIQYTIT